MVCANSYGLDANVYCFLVPFFASMSACSLPSMLMWALTLLRVVDCVRLFSILTISVSIVLSA